jgi:hypothetical protein
VPIIERRGTWTLPIIERRGTLTLPIIERRGTWTLPIIERRGWTANQIASIESFVFSLLVPGPPSVMI